jgi:transcriptional regulator with XRE-family HTH domain
VKNEQHIKQFGLEVKRRRLGSGLSQEDFAEVSELHRTYVSGIEQGRRNPTLDIVFRIAHALRCSPADLFVEDPK